MKGYSSHYLAKLFEDLGKKKVILPQFHAPEEWTKKGANYFKRKVFGILDFNETVKTQEELEKLVLKIELVNSKLEAKSVVSQLINGAFFCYGVSKDITNILCTQSIEDEKGKKQIRIYKAYL